jgi:hypothetical protein
MQTPVLETFAANPKHKREVCRYWINGLCRKESCEFLHVLDNTRMSVCPFGDHCRTPNCMFKHVQKENVCLNYQQGFCSLGRQCPHRHIHMQGPPPEVASYFLDSYVPYTKADRFFRTKACSYFHSNGWCPYFDMCAFRH